jgi:type IV secretory pathway ATPase VirB11/archaellum biosynthesis ATPase
MSGNTSSARFAVAFQLLSCTRCTYLGKCSVTKLLSRSAIKGRLLPEALGFIARCTNVELNAILRLMRNGGEVGLPGIHVARINLDNGCRVYIEPVGNGYMGYFALFLSRVVPSEGGLEELIRTRESLATNLVDDEYVVDAVLASLGIGELSPLIRMNDVEDIFITHESIYINHSIHGMCSVHGVDPLGVGMRILKLANLSGVGVSVERPSGKFSIRLGGILLRLTVDRWPLVESISVHVRRHKRIFTLTDLVRLGTLSREDAAGLAVAVRRGYSVIIMGPPSSGKTTLLNALDMVISPRLRRIYIDEADESLDMDVPCVKVRSISGKVEEVLRSLHRGFGILVIGELREREHFHALIHGVNSGLQVMATTHALDEESLARRLRSFGIEMDLGNFVTVSMARSGGRRTVTHVRYPQDLQVDHELGDKLANLVPGSPMEYMEAIDRVLGDLHE